MRNAGIWVGAMILLFAGTIFAQSLSYDYFSDFGPGPGLFPLWLSGMLIVSGVLYIITAIRKDRIDLSKVFPPGPGLRKVISIIAAVVIFLSLAPVAGYIPASVIMLFILFFADYKWYWNVGISIVVTLAIFYVFQSLLNVPLPEFSIG
ncbi:tripartite tricarboxylate transporter TctB family protein [Paenibacillus xerothermodurans]|uniref:Tripartite tricarboxylate transporter TctB family protein n=1 Tax=Paenibacillus xerothermodurans TaxID=1977292 RepID=A0A2W1NEQ1_PAEXE|nr:tripartite tricarboxylate transporter TctB family protein [Paenibacillus xerothermodurans]PZE22130.1 tripartite tricarboxylate transporter TctB family protein [Paenibacillus xerothermodurans]